MKYQDCRERGRGGEGEAAPRLAFIMIYIDVLMDSNHFVPCLEDAATNPLVTKLVLNGVDFTDGIILQSIQRLFQTCNHDWEEIDLKYCKGPALQHVVTWIMESVTKVHTLCLIANTLESNVAQALGCGLARNARLERLVIWGTCISSRTVSCIQQGMMTNDNLKELSFMTSHLDPDATEEIVVALQQGRSFLSLERLDMFSCGLDDSVVSDIVSAFSNLSRNRLESLDVGKNHCGSQSLCAIGRLLMAPHTCLKTLNLALQGNPNHVSSFFDISHMASTLSYNSTLVTLILRGNKISLQGMQALISCLQQNTTLERLWLTDCELCKPALEHFFSSLPSMKGLRKVWLNGYQSFGVSGKRELMKQCLEGMRGNVILDELHLPFGFDDYRSEVNVLLDLNRAGRRLLQQGPNPHKCHPHFPYALWTHVLGRVNTVHLPGLQRNETDQACRRSNMMYDLLRERALLEI